MFTIVLSTMKQRDGQPTVSELRARGFMVSRAVKSAGMGAMLPAPPALPCRAGGDERAARLKTPDHKTPSDPSRAASTLISS